MPELDRRDFLKLVGMGTGAAATVGCSDPIEKLVPYVIQPEEITPGLPTYYASTCEECSLKCGLHVKTREGRPIKLEGNPDHPINKGKLCARGQASIGRTYHPDRYEGPRASGEPAGWDEAQAQLVAALKGGSRKTWVLGGSRGPTVDGIIDAFVAGIGAAGRVVYAPFADEALRAATKQVFGVAALPEWDLSGADLVVDFGSDFIDASPVELAGQFAEARSISKHKQGGARLVSLSPRLSLTASNADEWIPAKPGSEVDVIRAVGAAALAKRGGNAGALAGVDLGAAATSAGVEPARLLQLVDRLAKAKNPVVLPPGVALTSTAAPAANAAVLLLNAALGAVGKTVKIPGQPDAKPAASMAEINTLIRAMEAGQVDVLLIHDANPVYSLPQSSGFQAALTKVKTVVSFASLMDETSEAAHLVLPDHTSLERWADAAPRSGVRSIVQPTIRPLHDTKAIGDVLLESARAAGVSVPAGSTQDILKANWGGAAAFRQALGQGGTFGASKAGAAQVVSGAVSFGGANIGGSGEYTVVAYPHSFLSDGSGAALPWLQEIPDPVGKTSWQSWAELSDATAAKLGVVFGDVVSISTADGTIDVPAYPRGGIRDDVVAVAIGQGHTVGHYASLAGDGEPGGARGANVISILPASTTSNGGRVWLGAKASLAKTGRFQRIPLSQWTDNQHERGLAPEVSLAALAGHDDHAEGGHHELLVPYEPSQDAAPDSEYRWGMTIDNDRCNGCSACISACYIENNVPVVGEEQAIRHREMTWIRIERYIGDGRVEYFAGDEGQQRRPTPNSEVYGEVGVRHVPMLCQHCGAAPCESVCPVIATYHTPEGINGMVYNRCVGTRYCANNCVYKVRRFNYWDYSQFNFPGLLGLMLNPDVTVRGQGVMEKCSFCYQRIAAARQTAKDESRPIADGEVTTACQQSCPTNAITFGNTRDPKAMVSKKAEEKVRAYHSLQVLNTRPAITYLAQINRADEESHG